MRAAALLVLATGCVGFYAEVGGGLANLGASGSAATLDTGGVSASLMFSVGLDSDFAHVSQMSFGGGEAAAHVGGSAAASGSAIDVRTAGAISEVSVDSVVLRVGAGLTMVQDQDASTPLAYTLYDFYFGPGITGWTSDHTCWTLWLSPHYESITAKDASYTGWGAEMRIRYTWLFGDSHMDKHPLR